MNKFCIYLLVIAFSFTKVISAQYHFLSECLKGGVVGDGYTAWYNGGESSVQLPIPIGCTVKKAIFFSNIYKWVNNNIPATDKFIEIDGQLLLLSESYQLGNQFYFSPTQTYVSTIAIDITGYINPNVASHIINPNNTGESPVQTPIFSDFYILVFYENSNFENTCTDVFINTQNSAPIMNYNINHNSVIDYAKDISLSVHSWGICNDPDDWFEVFANNISIGLIGGEEDNTIISCAGVIGSFYYENGELYGIGNDTGNITMSGLDAIANIQPYVIPNNSTNIRFEYTTNLSPSSNQINQLFLSYTTPCDTFSVDLSNDPQVCKGDSIQLNVTGGNEWEWEPAIGLSCTNCPNPYFTDTVSRWYTVRVWNNDSCSKVFPVRVAVVPKPLNPIVQTSPTKCSDSSGVATVQLIETSYLYAIDNGAFQSNAVFSQLSAGNHSISVVDTNGCVAETNFSISETFPTANFAASPQVGEVPLEVTFTNLSTGATDFIWYITNDTLYSVNPDYSFEEEGNFNVTLVAYDTYLHCSDTASVQIFATFPFTVIAPSLFVKQDAPYQIYTSNVATLQYELYNSIGQQLYNHSLQPTQGLNDVWYPYNISRGIYLYRITAKDDEGNEKVFSGKVVVM